MLTSPAVMEKPRILIAGGGFVGLCVAKRLQRKIAASGGVVTLVDPLPHMTYQPFLPEVIGGNIQPDYVVAPFRRHLRKTEIIVGKVARVDHAQKVAYIEPNDGQVCEIPYTDIIISAGAITRTFPIKGLAEHGISVKSIEEAVEIHSQVLDRLERASLERDAMRRQRLLTFVVVGGGFNGIETMGELQNMVVNAVKQNPRLSAEELRFVVVEAVGRIMPEVSEEQAQYVVDSFRRRGIEVLLNTSLDSAEGGVLRLVGLPDKKVVEEFAAETLIWAAGVQAHPVARRTGFPLDERGRVKVNAALQVIAGKGVIDNAWAAGDVAAVPDLTGAGVGGYCVPNAQHALRQAKRLAKNLLAVRAGMKVSDYVHNSFGAVAGLGLYRGVAVIIFGVKIPLRGFLAWLAHRGYHGLAMPTWERKLRIIGGWIVNFVLRRNISYLPALTRPHAGFEFAANPPKAEANEDNKDIALADGEEK